jgi:hypothetical protein
MTNQDPPNITRWTHEDQQHEDAALEAGLPSTKLGVGKTSWRDIFEAQKGNLLKEASRRHVQGEITAEEYQRIVDCCPQDNSRSR